MTFDAADRTAIRAHAERVRAASARLCQPAGRAQAASRTARQVVAQRRAVWQPWEAPASASAATPPGASVLHAIEELEAILLQLAGAAPTDSAALDRALATALTRAARAFTAAELRALTRDVLALGGLLGATLPLEPAPCRPRRFRPPLRR